jgi:membrane-associated phospholipid phosphatase
MFRRHNTAKTLVLVVLSSAALLPAPARAQSSGGNTPVCDVHDPVPAALREAHATTFTEEPGAGRWKPWNVSLSDTVVMPPPATASPQELFELAELHRVAITRTPEMVEKAKSWGEGAAGAAWTKKLLELITKHSTEPGQNPPRISREIAIFETAVLDALVVAWNAKYCYQRPAPSAIDPLVTPIVDVAPAPSYPSEHAVVAGVASILLPSFFPSEQQAVDSAAYEAAYSRIWAGANFRSDVIVGMSVGRAVARKVLAARANDGSSATWDGTGRITGKCNWDPTPPGFVYPPLEVVWGKVRPWVMTSGNQVRPTAPPLCDGQEYEAAARDLYEASLTLNARQKAIALYWAGGPGTETPPGMNLHIALDEANRHGLNTMRHARVLACVGVAEADAAIAAWDAKFTYWWDRPVQTIRRKWDPTWTSLITTPPFPGYISGHSTFSGAAAEVLAGFFPEDAVALRSMATEAAMSRFYAGIHARYDNEVGLVVGRSVAQLVLARAAGDGA